MRQAFPIRFARRPARGMRGLGWPILPDQFNTAAGVPEAFSPNTPDATVVTILNSQGQQLPPALAAAMAAGTASTTYVAPNQSPITSSVSVSPGVWLWTRADGSTFYGDANQNPVSYTPPAVTASGYPIPVPPALSTPTATATTPVATPAASSQPTAVVAPAVTPVPATVPSTTPIAVTPSGTPISTTTGTPAPTSAAVVNSVQGTIDSLITWLQGSLIGGIPNWLLVGGAVAGLMMFGGDGSHSRRR